MNLSKCEVPSPYSQPYPFNPHRSCKLCRELASVSLPKGLPEAEHIYFWPPPPLVPAQSSSVLSIYSS